MIRVSKNKQLGELVLFAVIAPVFYFVVFSIAFLIWRAIDSDIQQAVSLNRLPSAIFKVAIISVITAYIIHFGEIFRSFRDVIKMTKNDKDANRPK